MFAWFRKRLRDKERGFTLIELVVVLAIIGILIAAAVPLYLGARTKAYKAEADNALQEMKTMEWAYYQQYNTFTTTLGAGGIGFQPPTSNFWAYSAPTGVVASAVLEASGTNAPVTGSTIMLTLNNNGSTVETASF